MVSVCVRRFFEYGDGDDDDDDDARGFRRHARPTRVRARWVHDARRGIDQGGELCVLVQALDDDDAGDWEVHRGR